jgi:hypothetical protein
MKRLRILLVALAMPLFTMGCKTLYEPPAKEHADNSVTAPSVATAAFDVNRSHGITVA